MRTLAAVALAAILLCHVLAVWGLAGRPMHYDENEYLHASWLMAAGQRVYRDFFEDHAPHLSLMLQTVLPDGDLRTIDVRGWTVRARLLSGAFGTMVVLMAALFAWRMTRSPAAPVIAAAVILGSPQIWSRGLSDIRAEAPTLALFWTGLVLLTWTADLTRGQAMRAGAGIGLMFFASVWNPKWPLECALMGALYLHFLWRVLRARPRLLLAAIGPAIVLAVLAVLPIVTTTTLRDYLFFTFQLKSHVVGDFTNNPWIIDFFRRAPVWDTAALQHRWWLLVPVTAVVVMALALPSVRRAWSPANPRLAWIAAALHVSALIEFRFLYPYPYLWAQYLVMVATTAALVYALLPDAIGAFLPDRARPIVGVMAIVLAAFLALMPLRRMALTAFRKEPENLYWTQLRALQHSLGPNDTVWISPPRHPVAAFDASYYWYNFRESVPYAIRSQAKHREFLPAIKFEDLPPCRLADLPPTANRQPPTATRFLEVGDWIPFLDGVCGCVERAYREGRLTPADPLAIFEVNADHPPSPRGEAWQKRTDRLWADLCRRQKVFLQGGQLNITP